jgi:chromosome partitioning protein
MIKNRGQVCLIGGEKGGVGKSTITTNLAVEIAHRKAEVIIIDTDPQKTSFNWSERRSELIETKNLLYPNVNCVYKDGNLKDIVKSFITKYDVILIDASGRDSKSLRTGLVVSDKFICPTRASQADLETLPHVCNLIEIAKDFNDVLVAKAVISCVSTNPLINEAQSAQNLLSDFNEHLSLSNNLVHERKVYRDALLQGLGVVELDNIKATQEIKELVNEILEVK